MNQVLLAEPRPPVHFVAAPHPFRTELVRVTAPEGATLGEMIAAAGVDPSLQRYLRVWIDGHEVYPELWHRVRPRAGTSIVAKVVPHGGGGGGGKNPLRMILTIAVVALAAWAAGPLSGYLVGTGIFGTVTETGLALIQAGIQATITVAGMAAVNALVPLPSAPRPGAAGIEPPTLSITGTRNQYNPYGAVPVILGRRRVYPVYGARLYTELVGSDQYLRALFVVGYGPLQIEDLKIGETAIDLYSDVEYEVREGYASDTPLTLFPYSVSEQSLSIVLDNPNSDGSPGPWYTQTTQANTDEISIDISFLTGLVKYADGRKHSATVAFEVEYSPAGQNTWSPVVWDSPATGFTNGAISVTAAKAGVVRVGGKFSVTRGQYDVRIRRVTQERGDQYQETATWTALRSIDHTEPVNMAGLAKVAVRIRASEQLNGVIDTLNCVATSVLPDWNGAQWVTRATRNPAALFRAVLQGPANKRPVSDSRLDLVALQDWAEACSAQSPQGDGPMWTCDLVLDRVSTVYEVLNQIAATSRARFVMRDGKYSVVRDVLQSVPVQHFTPANSWGFSATRLYTQLPHALRCRWVNPDKGWQEDERVVYADGYDENNATLFEKVSMLAATRTEQVWREARYHLAATKLRPETYRLNVDVEHLVCEPGDLVRVTHDVPLWGLGWGRITSLVTNGAGDVTEVHIDNRVTMLDGESYAARIRKQDGSSLVTSLTTVPGENNVLYPSPAIPAAQAPAVGDLVMFGRAGSESVELLVRAIEPGKDLTAVLTLIDAAPAVHDSYTGTIPPYDSGISTPIPIQQQVPSAPVIAEVITDETVLELAADGTLRPRIVLVLSKFGPQRGGIDRQIRETNSGGAWRALPPVPTTELEVDFWDVKEGVSYDVRLRFVSEYGLASDWTTVTTTVIGKTSPPPDVTGLTAEIGLEGVTLKWDAVSVLDLKEYQLRVGGANWASATPVATVRTTELFVGPLSAGTYTYRVKAVDTGNRVSTNDGTCKVTIEAPRNPSATAQVLDNYVHLSYPTTTGSHIIDYFEVRRGDTYEGSTFLARTAGAFYPVMEPNSGTYTYWITAYDIAGNASESAKVQATVDQPTDYRLRVNWDSDLSGTKTNAHVDSGRLLLPANTAETWEEHFTNNGWTSPQDQIDAGYPYYLQPTPATAQYQEVFDYGALLYNVIVTISVDIQGIAGGVSITPTLETSLDGAQWSVFANSYQAAVGALRYLRVTLDVDGEDPHDLASIDLTARINVKLKFDSGLVAADSNDATGTWVPFNLDFVDVESITVAPAGASARYATYDFLDEPHPDGFRIFLWDVNGTRVSGDVSWTARGY